MYSRLKICQPSMETIITTPSSKKEKPLMVTEIMPNHDSESLPQTVNHVIKHSTLTKMNIVQNLLIKSK